MIVKVTVTDSDGDTFCVRVEGAVTQPQDGHDPLQDALGDSAYTYRVLMNFCAAESMDSAGVGWLMLCRQRFHDSGGRFVLHSQTPSVANVLRILSLDQTLNIAENEAEALRMLQDNG